MKASVLIEELEALIKEAGDLEVFINDADEGLWSPGNVRILHSYSSGSKINEKGERVNLTQETSFILE